MRVGLGVQLGRLDGSCDSLPLLGYWRSETECSFFLSLESNVGQVRSFSFFSLAIEDDFIFSRVHATL